jgi:hypothetical protein
MNADIKKRLMNLQKMAIMSNDGFATTHMWVKIHREHSDESEAKFAAEVRQAETQWVAQA